MLQVPYYKKDGQSAGALQVDESVFGDKVRTRLLHQIVVWYEANRRAGTHSALTRNEVSGSNHKPWPQKHTGMARAGTRRSPIWRHGGRTFPPKPRDYSTDIPKKMRHAALKSALLGKLRDKEVAVIEGFEFPKPSTKAMAGILKAIGIDRSCLIGLDADAKPVLLSARNLPRVDVARVTDFNAYDILRHRRLLLTKAALSKLGPADRPWISEGAKS